MAIVQIRRKKDSDSVAQNGFFAISAITLDVPIPFGARAGKDAARTALSKR
jgi:hypothetical protein